MAGLYGLGRNFYAYFSDTGTTYQVAITNDDAAAGDFGSPVTPGTYPSLPRGWRMRIQYGVSSTGIRTKIPVASYASTGWVEPAPFTKNSVTFNPEGSRGEQRYTRS